MGSIAAALPPIPQPTSQEVVPYRPQAQESSQGPAGNEQSGVGYRKVGDTYEIDGDDAPSTLDHGPEDAEDLPDRYYRLKTAIGHLLNAQAIQQGRRPAHNEHSVFVENRDRAEMVVDAFGEEKPWDIPLGWLSPDDRARGIAVADLQDLRDWRSRWGVGGRSLRVRTRTWVRRPRTVLTGGLTVVEYVAPPILYPRSGWGIYDYEYVRRF